MFSKILIANRGEIACRVIKTARKMGIKTVAVYSDADRDGLHVEMADEAIHIGAPPAAESYLRADRIIEACKQTGAQAVHPGFGFLSEKSSFCEALEKEGIVFIGPSVHSIGAMGDKIESKKLALEAKVSTVPGYVGEVRDAAHAVEIARDIGYPVMIKASAGGGGKGMRLAFNDLEASEGFTSATNEAISSFGDGRIFIEKFASEPRHIEIQVLGDKHGNIVYLNERECSIQRRHQKVVEEAPSPFLDPATRKAMGEQAVALARAVGYYSAGTVEFIVDKDRNFYFLEMNTRLQVEHPVTEMITGIDLVEQMIRVAYGEKLAFTQDDIGINGWAMETRVYAEDPYRGFLPSIGRLVKYQAPAATDKVRIDTGVFEGAEISMYYDPMIAKLITHGATREEAINLHQSALDSYYIRGISHNVDFLSAVMAHPRFRAGTITTGFIAEEFPDGFHGAELTDQIRDNLICAAAHMNWIEQMRAQSVSYGSSNKQPGFPRKPKAEWVVKIGGVEHQCRLDESNGGCDITLSSGAAVAVRSDWKPGNKMWTGTIGGKPVSVQIDKKLMGWVLGQGGVTTKVEVHRPRAAELARLMPDKPAPDMSKYLLCPMPGLVISIAVEEGEDVKAGQNLAVIEAMKMENVLKAERDGKVKKINAKKGDSLAVDSVIMEFETPEGK